MLDTLLQGYNPQYHFENNNNFVEAVNIVAQEKMIDLIITIPKNMVCLKGCFMQVPRRN